MQLFHELFDLFIFFGILREIVPDNLILLYHGRTL